MPPLRPAIALCSALVLAGCGWPHDPEGASQRVAGKVLRAGVSENPPWIAFQGDRVTGVEADFVRAIAADQGARVEWVRGGEDSLFHQLKANRLDLVAGGVTTESPWTKEMGAPRPYATMGGEKHLILAPPGENGWILKLERAARRHHSEIETWVAQATTRR